MPKRDLKPKIWTCKQKLRQRETKLKIVTISISHPSYKQTHLASPEGAGGTYNVLVPNTDTNGQRAVHFLTVSDRFKNQRAYSFNPHRNFLLSTCLFVSDKMWKAWVPLHFTKGALPKQADTCMSTQGWLQGFCFFKSLWLAITKYISVDMCQENPEKGCL